jgi:hypothetical protein
LGDRAVREASKRGLAGPGVLVPGSVEGVIDQSRRAGEAKLGLERSSNWMEVRQSWKVTAASWRRVRRRIFPEAINGITPIDETGGGGVFYRRLKRV